MNHVTKYFQGRAWTIELINNEPKLILLAIFTVFFILVNGRKSIFKGHSESEVQGQS